MRSIRYLDQEAALREFRRIFADDPDLTESITAEELPASFRVRLEEGSSGDRLVERLEQAVGVEDIAHPRRAITQDLRRCR